MYTKINYDERVGLYSLGIISTIGFFVFKLGAIGTDNQNILLLLSICSSVITSIYYFYNKFNDKKVESVEKAYFTNLKQLYQNTKQPIILGNTSLHWTQNQTRQILTGALTYAQPKEYSLYINCTNISNKTITAVEFEVKTLNAFNEQVSSFVVSTRKQLLFGNLTECSWDLNGSFDINNAITTVKRVMFSDGTIWTY